MKIPGIFLEIKRGQKNRKKCIRASWNVLRLDRSKRGRIKKVALVSSAVWTEEKKKDLMWAGRTWLCHSGSPGNISACWELHSKVCWQRTRPRDSFSRRGRSPVNTFKCLGTVLVFGFQAGWGTGLWRGWAKQHNTGLVHCISKVSPRRRLEADGSDLVKTAVNWDQDTNGTKTRSRPSPSQELVRSLLNSYLTVRNRKCEMASWLILAHARAYADMMSLLVQCARQRQGQRWLTRGPCCGSDAGPLW